MNKKILINKISHRHKDMVISKFLNENSVLIKKNECKEKCLEMIKNIRSLKNFLKKFSKKNLNKKGAILKFEKVFFKVLDKFFNKANKIEILIKDEQIINKLKKMFRNEMHEFLTQSLLIYHGYIKPRGYPGDYQIIEAMYDNKSISKNIGFFLDKYFLQDDYVKAVRDRKNKMKIILEQFINKYNSSRIRILNLACGSCREIRELLHENFAAKKNIDLILLDQDRRALNFAKKEIRNVPKNWKIFFLQENILNFLQLKYYLKKHFGEFDLIYSIGLADYLPSSILGLIIKYNFDILSEKGEFIVAHKNIREFSSPVSDWGADWKFLPRDIREFRGLIKKFIEKKYFLNYFFEKNKLIYFILLSNYQINYSSYLK